MDQFYACHQANHSEKTCPQWINSMTLVINHLLEKQFSSDENSQEDKTEEVTKAKETQVRQLCSCGIGH